MPRALRRGRRGAGPPAEAIRGLLRWRATSSGGEVMCNREPFRRALGEVARVAGLRLATAELICIESECAERDPESDFFVLTRRARLEPDADLRGHVRPSRLTEDTDAYIEREVLPHVSRTRGSTRARRKSGYESPINRHFNGGEPSRPLDG